jgi:hypothetical protein
MGTHPAICYRVIDLGTQHSSYKGGEKEQHKVMLSWELKGDDTLMEDGSPMSIHQRYTWSMFDRAVLRQHLESWRGSRFTDADFGPGGFDVRKLLGVPCLLGIVHEERNGRTYANVRGISRMPKGMSAGSLVNEPIYLWLSPEGWNQATFEKLSDHIQATIKKSPEYLKLMAQPQSRPEAPAAAFVDDEIPF